jgi:hypothetical protein
LAYRGTHEGRQKEKANPGNYDAVFETDHGLVAVECETGNISSSHRFLNKMAMGLPAAQCAPMRQRL